MRITSHQVPTLMMIYALGFIAIYFIFFLMHFNAYRKSKKLGLTPLEKFDCKSDMFKEIIMVSTGICSLIVSLLLKDEKAGFAGRYLYADIPCADYIFYI